MKKAIAYIAGILAGITMYTSAMAQDFYNGCRGPKPFQIDAYYSDEKTKVIPKFFVKNLEKNNPDLEGKIANILIAAPFSVSSEGKVENQGLNLGYIVETKYVNYILAGGIFKDAEGKYNVFNPQIYFTSERCPWTFDLEGNLPIHLRSHDTGGMASATLGYGINKWLRVGGSAIKEKGKDLDYRANVRFDLDPVNHTTWFQLYAGKENVGARFVVNF